MNGLLLGLAWVFGAFVVAGAVRFMWRIVVVVPYIAAISYTAALCIISIIFGYGWYGGFLASYTVIAAALGVTAINRVINGRKTQWGLVLINGAVAITAAVFLVVMGKIPLFMGIDSMLAAVKGVGDGVSFRAAMLPNVVVEIIAICALVYNVFKKFGGDISIKRGGVSIDKRHKTKRVMSDKEFFSG